MKRKLSLLLSLMMVLTLIPMSSFAATANRVNRQVSVTSDGTTGDLTTAPVLIIQNDKDDLNGVQQVFRVELGANAEWHEDYSRDALSPTNLNVDGATGQATAVAITSRILEVTIDNTLVGDEVLEIPLAVDFNGAAEGAQRVTVNPRNSSVSPGEYTYATIGAGRISALVDTKVNISRGSSAQNEVSIILDEVATTSFRNNEELVLRLPRNFSWVNEAATLDGANVLAGTAVTNGGRDLNLNLGTNPTTGLDSVIINAEIRPTRDASFGDITVNVVKGNISPSSFVIGKYVDFNAMVSVDKVLDVISGKNEDGLYVAKLIIEEPVAGTLLQNRFIEMSFGKDVASLENGETIEITRRNGSANLVVDANSSRAVDAAGDIDTNPSTTLSAVEEAHKWDLEVTGTNTSASKFEIEIPFVVSAAHEGDVVLTVKGAGIESQDIVIAKAVKPVKVEVSKDSADLKIGLQGQDAPDIIITETEAGALSENTLYTLRSTSDYTINWTAATIEVIEGDLELDDVDTERVTQGINIVVDGKSTRPSTIKISGVKVTLDRTVPYGPFNLDFNFGSVYRDRGAEVNTSNTIVHKNLSDRVARLAYFNVVTPVQDNQRMTAVFTIGDANYTVNGEAMTLDAAPFISNNRTMLPIGAIAQVVGATVNYSPVTRTAIFTKDGVVVSMTLDQPFLTANGVVIPMDSAPVVVNSRAFVPMAFVAQAFGVPVQYDAAARTVTVN